MRESIEDFIPPFLFIAGLLLVIVVIFSVISPTNYQSIYEARMKFVETCMDQEELTRLECVILASSAF